MYMAWHLWLSFVDSVEKELVESFVKEFVLKCKFLRPHVLDIF